MSDTPTLPEILNDVAELGSRIGALRSLGAGFAAALRAGTIPHDDVAILIDGYTSSLVALQEKVAGQLTRHMIEGQQSAADRYVDAVGERRHSATLTRTVDGPRDNHAAAA